MRNSEQKDIPVNSEALKQLSWCQITRQKALLSLCPVPEMREVLTWLFQTQTQEVRCRKRNWWCCQPGTIFCWSCPPWFSFSAVCFEMVIQVTSPEGDWRDKYTDGLTHTGDLFTSVYQNSRALWFWGATETMWSQHKNHTVVEDHYYSSVLYNKFLLPKYNVFCKLCCSVYAEPVTPWCMELQIIYILYM